MERQHLSKTKNTIAPPQSQNAIARSSTHPIEELQDAIGNRAVNQLLANQPIVQAKPMFKGLSHELRSPTPIQTKSSGLAKTGIPDNLKTNMENAFNTDFSDVKIHEGLEPLSIGALAYTQGNNIYFAPGQYNPTSQKGQELLGHELTHIVQQKQGRVAGSTTQGLSMNTDSALEMEADRAGTRAARGETVEMQGNSVLGQPATSVVQAKLGFELEILTLVDVNGRPAREKIPLGTVGQHLELTADQNSQVATNTPTPAATVGNYQSPWFNRNGNPQNRTLGNYDLPAGWQRGVAYVDGVNVNHYADRAALDRAHPVPNPGSEIKEAYQKISTGEWTLSHPTGDIGMGKDRYASILEIVTKAYEPETDEGAANISEAMQDAVNFVNNIPDPTQHRTQLNTIANVNASSSLIHVGNPNQAAQSTNASIQTNLGIRIEQLAAYVQSTMNYQNQGFYKLKHHSDPGIHSGTLVQQEMTHAVVDANDIIDNQIGTILRRSIRGNKNIDLRAMRGLFVLINQYLRLGKQALDTQTNQWALDKNVVALMSRTDLSTIFQSLPSDDRNWLEQNRGTVITQLLTKAGRAGNSQLFTDPTEAQTRYTRINITAERFLINIFTRDSDGVTAKFGAIRTMPMEVVKRKNFSFDKKGAVFEVRNMVPSGGGDRFTPEQWVNFANYHIQLLRNLNTRSSTTQTSLSTVDLGINDPGLEQLNRDEIANFHAQEELVAAQDNRAEEFRDMRSRLKPTGMRVRYQ